VIVLLITRSVPVAIVRRESHYFALCALRLALRAIFVAGSCRLSADGGLLAISARRLKYCRYILRRRLRWLGEAGQAV
jgi:hypothetical protein